jgi:hypothetical protein
MDDWPADEREEALRVRKEVYGRKLKSFKKRWTEDFISERSVNELEGALGQITSIEKAGVSVEDLDDTKQLITKCIEEHGA